jgi:hypothetical protein
MPGDSQGHAGWSIECLVAVGNEQCALQDDEMLTLVLMDMHSRAVLNIRDQLKHHIGAPTVRGGGSDFETFSRGYVHPFTTSRRIRAGGIP